MIINHTQGFEDEGVFLVKKGSDSSCPHRVDKVESADPVLRHKRGYEVPPGTDHPSLSRTVWNPQKG